MKIPPLSPSTPIADSTPIPAAAGATASSPPAAEPEPDTAPDPIALQKLADQLTQSVGMSGQQVQFSVDDATGKTVLRVTDAESGAVLRQIPGDEALSMARILDRMQGVLIRQKA